MKTFILTQEFFMQLLELGGQLPPPVPKRTGPTNFDSTQ